MSGRSNNCSLLAVCDQPYPGAHLNERFESSLSGVQQILVQHDFSGLGQENYRRPTETKVAFLLASLHRSALVGLNNTTDGQGAHLDLQHSPTIRVGEHADHALVSKTRCSGSQCDWMDRVQCAPDTNNVRHATIGREMEAMIIAGCQPNNETSTRFETVQATNKLFNIYGTALNVKFVPRHVRECQHSTLGGCDQVVWILIDRSRLGFELACKKSVQRTVARSGKLRFGVIDSVLLNEGTDLASANRRSIQKTGEMAKPLSLDESMQKRSSPPRLIKKAELAFAIDALRSQFAAFPVDIVDLFTRRSHMRFLHSAAKRDRSADNMVDYTVASIDPSSAEFHDFAALPHARSLNALAPSAEDVMKQLGTDSLFYRHGETRLFACYRNGQLVGRAVASVDHHFPDQDVGHFGYFEACADKACAENLMHACEEWLRRKGKNRIEGPINLNMLAGYRFQVTGFDTQAFPGEPRNPDYYPDLFESLGYREFALWRSWDISPLALLGLRAIDWLQRSRRRATKSSGYRIEVLRADCLEEETRKIHYLVHEIFADNYGFSPIDLAEHIQMQGAAMDGSAKVGGAFLYHSTQREPVGFSYGFYVDGTAIFHTFGVTKAHRGTGGADLLFHQGLQNIRSHGISRAIGALAKEGKSKYERIGRPRRAYAIVGKDL